MMWDIDRMKPLSATVVLSYFIYSELSPFYGIIREDDKIFDHPCMQSMQELLF